MTTTTTNNNSSSSSSSPSTATTPPTTTLYDPALYDSLESYAEQMNAQLAGKSAPEVIAWSLATFGPAHTALSSSFGIQSAVMLHLVTAVDRRVPVIWIDTGYLPKETYQFAARLTRDLGLTVRAYQSPLSPARMEALYGRLWEVPTPEAHTQYGFIRKVEPMQRALRELDVRALLVGVRAEQTAHRETMKVVNVQDGRLKICPILHWSKADIEQYMAAHGLPYHPLKAQGYETVGDAHSSRPVTAEDAGNERASRFHGVAQECGLHLDLQHMRLEDLTAALDEDPAALSDSEQELVRKTRAPKGIIIFTKPKCKYCLATKDVFRERDWSFEEVTVGGEDLSIPSLQRIVGRAVKTVPQIFIDGVYVGGYTELCAFLDIPSRFAA